MREGVRYVVRRFLKTTTLNGLKYFLSPSYLDCSLWALCVCVCVCAGGALCAALWGRFVKEPTLLAVLNAAPTIASIPAVALCPTPARVAQLFTQKMSVHEREVDALPLLFDTLLRDKLLADAQVQLLERLLLRNNVTLSEALMNISDACSSVVRACRAQGREQPCDQLFQKTMMARGACCLLPSHESIETAIDAPKMNTPSLDLLVQCPEGSVKNCYEFFTRFRGEDGESLPIPLNIGYLHIVTLSYTFVKDSTRDTLFQGKCESTPGYRMDHCIMRCSEQHCGCSEPLHQAPAQEFTERARALPVCPVAKLNCINFYQAEGLCKCPSACQKVSSFAKVESSQITQVGNTLDRMFAWTNGSSMVVSLRINRSASRMFELINNQTWWSLLSSLGGVFSMFLGVSAITLLELAFFLLRLLHGSRCHRPPHPSPHPTPHPPPLPSPHLAELTRTRR